MQRMESLNPQLLLHPTLVAVGSNVNSKEEQVLDAALGSEMPGHTSASMAQNIAKMLADPRAEALTRLPYIPNSAS